MLLPAAARPGLHWAEHVVMELLSPGTCWLGPLPGRGKHMQKPKDNFFLFAPVLHTPEPSNWKGWIMSSIHRKTGAKPQERVLLCERGLWLDLSALPPRHGYQELRHPPVSERDPGLFCLQHSSETHQGVS